MIIIFGAHPHLTGWVKRIIVQAVEKTAWGRLGQARVHSGGGPMLSEDKLQALLNIEVDPQIFASVEAKVLPPRLVEHPHELFESIRERHGDVLELVGGKIDDVDISFLMPNVEGRKAFVALGMKNARAITKIPETFEQNYGRHMGVLMGENVVVGLNPPVHRKYRSLISQAFNMRSVEDIISGFVEPLLHGIADSIEARGLDRFDLVTELSNRLPMLVIGEIFDLPTELYTRFAQLATDLMNNAYDWDRAISASNELRIIFEDLIRERRAAPGDDLISSLLSVELEGETLSDPDVISFCRALVPAGIETTTRGLSTLFTALLSDRSRWEQLKADASLIPAAVEETLRWNGPAQILPKRVAYDTSLGGKMLPAGSDIWLYIGHASKDPEVFDDAFEFDMQRPKAQHMGFSLGAHMCVGNQLARQEMQKALTVMLQRFPDMQLDRSQPPPKIVGFVYRSTDHLYVRV